MYFSSRKGINLIASLLLLTISGFFLIPLLTRPIWFDEAWSIMVYTTLPYSKIYLSYSAPNNHILLNIILKFWLDSTCNILPLSEATFRLFSLTTSFIVIFLMFRFWRKRLGLSAAFLTILSFSVSTPFLIYGSALRGYMLSLIFILCSFEAGLRFIETGRKKFILFYFLSVLAGVAVIPSNIFVFAMIAIFPSKKSLWNLIKERWLLAILPLVAFALFYGPIWKQLYSAIKNNNGWLYPFAAVGHLYSALLFTLLPIIIPAAIGGVTYIKNKTKNRSAKFAYFHKKSNAISRICLLLIFAAPALVIITRNPAPFPRVFFQMWPLWLFLIGVGVKHITATIRLTGSPKKLYIVSAVMTVLIIIWGVILQLLTPQLSTLFTRKFSQDDFFQPYYMQSSFNPLKTVDVVIRLTKSQKQRVFLSQYADFPSLIFYGKLKGLKQDFWITDYPEREKIDEVPDTGKYYIIAKNKRDFSLIKTRFNLKNIKIIDKNSFQKIYEVENGN